MKVIITESQLKYITEIENSKIDDLDNTSNFLKKLEKLKTSGNIFKNKKKPGQKIDYDSNVELLQKALIILNYPLSNWGADGMYGAETQYSVEKFQKDSGLAVTGNIEPGTISKIIDEIEKLKIKDNEVENLTKKEKNIKPEPSGKKGTPYQVMKFLIDKGLTQSQAAGITGNLDKESGLNPTVKPGDGGTSFGIAQWHESRGNKMKKWVREHGYKTSDIIGQLEYLWWELQNDEKNALKKLKLTDTPKDAAFMFAKYFERCSACNNPRKISDRLNRAQKFFDDY
jgi:peptidoglycan hydrolase-like protein with peptidoglycan-binding domain